MSAKRCLVSWGLAMMKLSTSNLVIAVVIAFGLQMPFAVPIKAQDNSIIDPVMIPLVEESLHVLYFYHQRPNGKASKELTEAIRAFQQQNGMPPTGQLTNSKSGKLFEQADQYKFSQITIDPLEGIGESPVLLQTENSVDVAGTWVISDDNKDVPLNVAKISCNKTDRVCHEVFAWLVPESGFAPYFRVGSFADDRKTGSTHLYLSIDTSEYDITSWSQYELIANRQTGCSVKSLTITFRTKNIIYKDTPTLNCSESILRNKVFNRPITAKMIDGTSAQKSFYEKKNIETHGYLMK